jgi:hypothetical protein
VTANEPVQQIAEGANTRAIAEASPGCGLLKDEHISISVISHSSSLLQIEGEWNRFIGNNSANPFFLSEFVKQFLRFSESRGWTPAVLVFRTNQTIVGVAPLITKRKFGMRFARTLLHDIWATDFIFEDEHREDCIAKVLDFLFKTLHCQMVRFTLPCDSPNLRALKQKENDDGRIQLSELPTMGRSVLCTDGDWAEFAKSRGKKFRRDIKRTEDLLDAAGLWNIKCTQKEMGISDVFSRIFEVERRSWKQAWLTKTGEEVDPDLIIALEASRCLVEKEPDFNWAAWLLELNCRTVAYALVFLFWEWAIIAKTSYDARYGKFSPGIYVINAAIRELLDECHIGKIDFMTDLFFTRTWTSLCLPQVTLLMSRKGPLSVILNVYVRFISSVQNTTSLRLFSRSILALARAYLR